MIGAGEGGSRNRVCRGRNGVPGAEPGGRGTSRGAGPSDGLLEEEGIREQAEGRRLAEAAIAAKISREGQARIAPQASLSEMALDCGHERAILDATSTHGNGAITRGTRQGQGLRHPPPCPVHQCGKQILHASSGPLGSDALCQARSEALHSGAPRQGACEEGICPQLRGEVRKDSARKGELASLIENGVTALLDDGIERPVGRSTIARDGIRLSAQQSEIGDPAQIENAEHGRHAAVQDPIGEGRDRRALPPHRQIAPAEIADDRGAELTRHDGGCPDLKTARLGISVVVEDGLPVTTYGRELIGVHTLRVQKCASYAAELAAEVMMRGREIGQTPMQRCARTTLEFRGHRHARAGKNLGLAGSAGAAHAQQRKINSVC